MSNDSLLEQIKAGKAQVFRRVFIKRMLGSGQFESSWLDISRDVKKWGSISKSVDSIQIGKFKFGPTKIVFANEIGKYNPHDDESSLWFGYTNQQRTLVKIEAGFVQRTLRSDGIWQLDEFPNALWDEDQWDGGEWDVIPTVFKGIISGDIIYSDKNEVTFNIMPMMDIFRQYPARNLRGLDNSITASRFIEVLRDQTDGSGNYIFRPFFDNTTSSWDIQTTTNIYTQLNTNTTADLIEMNVWEVIERLCQSENYVAYISTEGYFRFKSRTNLTTTSYSFYGTGWNSGTYGTTIKSISQYGPVMSKFYSRVDVHWFNTDTVTSHEVVEATLTVSGNSSAWVLGVRTFNVENFWIPTSTVANTVAQNIFNDYSALKKEIKLTTSFIPHLDVFDSVNVYYDSSYINPNSLWDYQNWGEDTTTVLGSELVFDDTKGDPLVLNGKEFKLLAIELDLENLSTNFHGREG